MAKKRMFSKQITDADAFMDMPLSTQALYFHLNMNADDDGFVNSPKRISRTIGASEDDLKLLIAKNFIIPFESGVVVVKHWKMHNTIQKDRYTPTVYTEEKSLLIEKDNKAYSLVDTECIQNGYKLDTQNRLDKNRLDKGSCIDLLDMLTVEEIERLKELYVDHYELIDAVQTDANRKQKQIDNPLNYIIGYATNKGWLTK